MLLSLFNKAHVVFRETHFGHIHLLSIIGLNFNPFFILLSSLILDIMHKTYLCLLCFRSLYEGFFSANQSYHLLPVPNSIDDWNFLVFPFWIFILRVMGGCDAVHLLDVKMTILEIDKYKVTFCWLLYCSRLISRNWSLVGIAVSLLVSC